MPGDRLSVIGGAHTHRDGCVAAVVDAAGRLLGTASFSAAGGGWGELLEWLRGWGGPQRVGVDGGCGAGLARRLAAAVVSTMVGVIGPNRRARRRGESDPAGAEAAAPAVLSAGAPARR